MKKKALSLVLTVLVTSTIVFTGCGKKTTTNSAKDSNFKSSGLPIVKKKVTLKIVSPKSALAPNYDKMTIFKRLEKSTNIHIDWTNIPDTDYQTKKNLLLASGDLPDAFYAAGFSDADMNKYGKDGTIVPLGSLINKYMPNVKKLLNKEPDLKTFITSPDGKIYSLPVGEEMGTGKNNIGSNPYFYFINKTWLKKIGKKVPTTLDELHEDLLEFKNKDLNGNGKQDEIPMKFISNFWCADIGNFFGSFGIPDPYTNAPYDHLIVRNGKIVFAPEQPEYKQAVQYFSKWVKEGLIDKSSFTDTTADSLFAKGKTKPETLGSFVWWEETEIVGTDREKEYALVGPLTGPTGKSDVVRSNGSAWSRGAFVITKDNKHPEVTARWIDQLYSPLEAAQIHWGPIGEVYNLKNGKLVNKPLPKGVTMGEYRQKVAPSGVGVVTANDFNTIVDMEARAKERINRIKNVFAPNMADENIPTLFFTDDETSRRNQIETDLKAYVNKMKSQWLMNGNLTDAAWNTYLNNLKKIGVDQFVKITQDAYDRYQKQNK
ncbi:extracellular solute-binding protein [Clostridium oryzae]|uniref:Lipoprotein LipO n=1 Tax=Clostridium oryzae TaxID=1450648 RepID=A0A1V4IKN5_9CLOT|nr:extracellular solute-binding protein [Clostridium oryzae]OPJ60591.1 lipoprotein LipO precursor [Clostridium oryzae]